MDGKAFEKFHSILSGLAARCNLETLQRRILRDVFIVNMSNEKAQTELCRSFKTPERVYRLALSYEQDTNTPRHTKVPVAASKGTDGGAPDKNVANERFPRWISTTLRTRRTGIFKSKQPRRNGPEVL